MLWAGSAEPGKADRRQGSDCSLDQWAAGYILHPGSGRLHIIQVFFFLLILRAARQGRRAQVVLWLSVWAYTLTVGLCSFVTRMDVRLTPQPGHVAQSALTGLKTFFLGRPTEYMPLVIAIPVAVFFLLALTGRLGLIKWITAGWLLVVVYFSVTSGGYAQYDPVYTLYGQYCWFPS